MFEHPALDQQSPQSVRRTSANPSVKPLNGPGSNDTMTFRSIRCPVSGVQNAKALAKRLGLFQANTVMYAGQLAESPRASAELFEITECLPRRAKALAIGRKTPQRSNTAASRHGRCSVPPCLA
ncbi:uncharacterized protein DSM5745_03318 [Aspergillus mulundensis]|uniref:Uncharacterized protein n=1 Tax=Aspergillus mulundensis TaxID=1810919 RepID=A0A3D8SK73_9EURO|nr:hypothetical protein DSM5745_03318 [Aspergillus mulundensis]RDW86676.1 hypothetical protein DSM5745_03318 [Aspergillus mulundensis]